METFQIPNLLVDNSIETQISQNLVLVEEKISVPPGRSFPPLQVTRETSLRLTRTKDPGKTDVLLTLLCRQLSSTLLYQKNLPGTNLFREIK